MFENTLALELYKFKDEAGIWLEGESQRIGHVNIPPSLFAQMRAAQLIFVDIPFEERLKHIIENYGKASKDKLMSATMRLQKRLGGLETKNAINALLEDDIKLCFTILLKYYDRWYLSSTYEKQEVKREIVRLECATTSESIIYDTLMQHVIRTND
jgi:tRNA 2-selenouridine synthase